MNSDLMDVIRFLVIVFIATAIGTFSAFLWEAFHAPEAPALQLRDGTTTAPTCISRDEVSMHILSGEWTVALWETDMLVLERTIVRQAGVFTTTTRQSEVWWSVGPNAWCQSANSTAA